MRAIIVEDEDLIREGLVSLIDWQAEGFVDIEDYNSASDALDDLEKKEADLILTDIFMPVISGLEFIKMAKEIQPHAVFIILSGHERFEYAQKAIELGVWQYLIKPITPLKLLDIIRKAKKSIKENQKMKSFLDLEITHGPIAKTIINDAKKLIDENYKNPEISVGEIARKLSITPSYLSRIFRNEMGMTCVEYLTSRRINAAKKLLRHSSVKSYEIAGMVGYNNPHYFSTLFKKSTGLSPREYKTNEN